MPEETPRYAPTPIDPDAAALLRERDRVVASLRAIAATIERAPAEQLAEVLVHTAADVARLEATAGRVLPLRRTARGLIVDR